MTATFSAVAAIAVTIVGFGGYATWQSSRPASDKLAAIDGLVDYRAKDAAMLSRGHKSGPLTYKVSPSVGGDHNAAWQNCTGDVYEAPIANEHATHSLEHGAVWATYRAGLAQSEVDQLAKRVQGVDYMFMSPEQNLDAAVSLQAWGYRLAVDSAADDRIDEFIRAARITAAAEPGATCSGGVTATGKTPQDDAGMPQGQ